MKALIITVQGIGNTILALPALQALKAKGASMDAIVSGNGSSDILAQMNLVDEILVWDERKAPWMNFLNLGSKLLGRKYSDAYALCPAGKRENILLRFARASSKHGWRYARGGASLLACGGAGMLLWDETRHDLFSNQTLLSLNSLEIEKGLEEITKKLKASAGKKNDGKTHIGIQPFSHVKAKCWLPAEYTQLISLMQKHLPAEFHLFGSMAASKEMNMVKDGLAGVHVHSGLAWKELVGRIGALDFFIGVDSSVSHLAAVSGISTCVLYGITVPERTAALGKNVLVIQGQGSGKSSYGFSQGYKNSGSNGLSLKPEKVSEIALSFFRSGTVSESAVQLPFGAKLWLV